MRLVLWSSVQLVTWLVLEVLWIAKFQSLIAISIYYNLWSPNLLAPASGGVEWGIFHSLDITANPDVILCHKNVKNTIALMGTKQTHIK